MIKKIKQEYKNGGIDWLILERRGNVTIAERQNGPRSYEVCLVRVRKPTKFVKDDMTLEGVEYLPSNNEFGIYGWSFKQKELAVDCFERLCSREAYVNA